MRLTLSIGKGRRMVKKVPIQNRLVQGGHPLEISNRKL